MSGIHAIAECGDRKALMVHSCSSVLEFHSSDLVLIRYHLAFLPNRLCLTAEARLFMSEMRLSHSSTSLV